MNRADGEPSHRKWRTALNSSSDDSVVVEGLMDAALDRSGQLGRGRGSTVLGVVAAHVWVFGL